MKNTITYISLLIILVCGIAGVSSVFHTGTVTYDGEGTDVTELLEEEKEREEGAAVPEEEITQAEGVAEIIVEENLEKTRAANNVAAVVFDFRGFDTLGESFILLTAIAGSFVILSRPKKARGKEEGR